MAVRQLSRQALDQREAAFVRANRTDEASRISEECRRDAARQFSAHGIHSPTPCQLAWYAAHKDYSRRRRSRRTVTETDPRQRRRRSPLDMPKSDAVASHVFRLMVAKQGLAREAAEELFSLVTEEPIHVANRDDLSCHAVVPMCIPWECPVYNQDHPLGGPAFKEFQDQSRGFLDQVCGEVPAVLENGGDDVPIRLAQVPMVGGKTWQLAKLALGLVRGGQPFYVVVDDHHTGQNFFDQLKAQLDGTDIPDGRRIVFMFGRDKGECGAPADGNEAGCAGCPRWRAASGKREELQGRSGVFDKNEVEGIAEQHDIRCRHAVSRILSDGADAVVMAENYVLDPSLRFARPRLRKSLEESREVVLWDEADTLLDKTVTLAARKHPLLMCRVEGASFGLGTVCHRQCESCSFVVAPGRALETFRDGMAVFERIRQRVQDAEPVILLDAVRSNLAAVKALLDSIPESQGPPFEALRNAISTNPGPLGLYDPEFEATTPVEGRNSLREAILALNWKGRLSRGDVGRLSRPVQRGLRIPELNQAESLSLQRFLCFADATNGHSRSD